MPTSVVLAITTYITVEMVVSAIISFVLQMVLRAAFAPKQQSGAGSLTDPGRTITFAEAAPDWQVIYGRTRIGGRYVFRHVTNSQEVRLFSEEHVIPTSAPHEIAVTPNGLNFESDHGVSWVREVQDEVEHTAFTAVASAPGALEYTVDEGTYTFNEDDAGKNIQINYDRRALAGPAAVHNRLHLVIVFAAHEVEEIGDIYFNDELATLDADGNGIGKYAGHVSVLRHLGSDDQAADESLMAEAPAHWTNAHRLRGHAYIYVRLIRNPDLFPDVPNVTAVIKGKRVLDPRTGATGWTDNAALCIADYLNNSRFGLGAEYGDEIDEDALIAAANVCDEEVALGARPATFTADASADTIALAAGAPALVSGMGVTVSSDDTLPGPLSAGTTYYVIPAAGGAYQLATTLARARAGLNLGITNAGSGTHTLARAVEPRYTLNGGVSTAETPQAIIEKMLSALAGRAVYAAGTWRIHAAAYATPTVTLDEGDMRGPVKVTTRLARRDAANGVKGLFVNIDSLWQATDFPPIASDTYMAEDGNERIWRDIELPFTHSQTTAKRNAKIELLRARQGITVELECKLTAFDIVPPDTFMLSLERFGWASKVFECVEAKLVLDEDGALGVNLVGRETAAAVFDWATNEEDSKDPAPNTTLPSRFHVRRPGAPVVTESLYQTREGGGIKIMATVEWEASNDGAAWRYELQYKRRVDERWTSQSNLDGTRVELTDLRPVRYQFRVRALSALRRRSLWSQSEYEFQGLAARPATVAGLTGQAMGGMAVLNWDQHADLDVRQGGEIIFRHSPLLVGATWSASTRIGKIAPGHVTTWNLPLKAGTYLAKARDSGGRVSLAASSVRIKQASIHAFTTLQTITEE